jgi:hypothetical protein
MEATVTCDVIVAALTAPPASVMARARRFAEVLPVTVDLDWLVEGRARRRGWYSRGQTSANGSCRLLPTIDGWVAVNLPRPSDVEALPAIVEAPVDADEPWTALADFAQVRPARTVADRCQLFEVAAAVLDDPTVDGSRAAVTTRVGDPDHRRHTPLVVDLSAMWAGPLCAHLLGRAGMRVVKVESSRRPDGLRDGDPHLFEQLHAGHEQRMYDFDAPDGRAALVSLVHEADVVIESSRPRALAQLGIDANEIVAANSGCTWVSITGYGRSGANGQLVAFGDDAAVAGGLVVRDATGRPAFCADAIADPMTGLVAATAVHRSVSAGGGHVIDVAMAAVAKSLVIGP